MDFIYPKFLNEKPKPLSESTDYRQAVGKTVKSIELGNIETHPECHKADGMVLHFIDGSAMIIRIGSNVQNVISDFDLEEKVSPQDFHADLMTWWLPPGDKKN